MNISQSGGYRGSSSEQASLYKKDGHLDEELFAELISGQTISGQQKRDVVGPDKVNYSVKGGSKHWQIMLYGQSNFKDKSWGELGPLFAECINCFPSEIATYFKDKIIAKKNIYSYLTKKSGIEIFNSDSAKEFKKRFPKNWKETKNKLRNNQNLLKELIGSDNSYLSAKIKLQIVTKKMKEKFDEPGVIRSFLRKGIFNDNEVDKLVIKENEKFLVFDKTDVLNIFEEVLITANSVAGNRIDDINIDGQKTVLKYQTNIVTLEIRNDEKHYREVRFNMERSPALKLLKEKSIEVKSFHENIMFLKKK